MTAVSRTFQIFAKPAGPACNLACAYCYYLDKKQLFSEVKSFRMTDDMLERYIKEHIAASGEDVIRFSWHGGEPTVLGLDYFRNIAALQRKHCPPERAVINGIQTNGTLLDDDWCRFFAEEGFIVGISLDGPKELHDRYRAAPDSSSTFDRVMRGYELLQKHNVHTEVLCVVNEHNVLYPLDVYRFFKQLDARYITFLPLVEPMPDNENGVSGRTVIAEEWGAFLCTVFDEWKRTDTGRINIQIFEEAIGTAFGCEHALCIFRPECGDVPVVEHNGDFYACDHFVDNDHRIGNIGETPLAELLEHPSQRAFGQAKQETLPQYCRSCPVVEMCNGGCPKNRFTRTPDGEDGLNYLCAGYKTFFSYCAPFVSEIAALWNSR